MTKIKVKAKPVWHETHMDYNGRAIVVAETPVNLLLRLKGTRGVLKLPWTCALLRAAMIEAAEQRLRKMAERKAKKRGKRK